jgi:tripartite-type tricarboxylate transporter receptor subunit TctC
MKLLLTWIALLGVAGPAAAQPYPAKPVKIIVPFGPGGSGDITARTFAQYLETRTRQAVVVENKPGANGIIGTEAAKMAPPDGYTLLLTTNTTHAANVSLYRKLPYDALKDFEHIGLFGTFASVAVVPPGSGIQSIPDLVAYAKANPGKVFFGHYKLRIADVRRALQGAGGDCDDRGAL